MHADFWWGTALRNAPVDFPAVEPPASTVLWQAALYLNRHNISHVELLPGGGMEGMPAWLAGKRGKLLDVNRPLGYMKVQLDDTTKYAGKYFTVVLWHMRSVKVVYREAFAHNRLF
jgi:hypothetical protein